MSVLELKNDILTDLATLNDEQALLQVRALLDKILRQSPSDQETSWWNSLADADSSALRRALDEADHPERLTDTSTSFKNQGQWLA